MKLSFCDFWYGFDYNNNFITHLFKSIFENLIITSPQDCDYLIYSIFGSEHLNHNHCKKIFYTGENVRPNFNECHYSFSFDFDSYQEKNVRVPLWYFYIDWFNVGSYGNPSWLIPLNYLTETNEFVTTEKQKFCSTVFSSPYDHRFNAIKTINNYKKVDCFGKCHEMQIPQQDNHGGEYDKMKVISQYKFSICFENSEYPGYFTEKLLHSKIAGNIPIYYSHKSFSEDFNQECCLNLVNYPSMEYLLSDVIELDNDSKKYNKIISEPLFNKTPSLDSLKEKVYHLLH
jgi:hypothetical protein